MFNCEDCDIEKRSFAQNNNLTIASEVKTGCRSVNEIKQRRLLTWPKCGFIIHCENRY